MKKLIGISIIVAFIFTQGCGTMITGRVPVDNRGKLNNLVMLYDTIMLLAGGLGLVFFYIDYKTGALYTYQSKLDITDKSESEIMNLIRKRSINPEVNSVHNAITEAKHNGKSQICDLETGLCANLINTKRQFIAEQAFKNIDNEPKITPANYKPIVKKGVDLHFRNLKNDR